MLCIYAQTDHVVFCLCMYRLILRYAVCWSADRSRYMLCTDAQTDQSVCCVRIPDQTEPSLFACALGLGPELINKSPLTSRQNNNVFFAEQIN